MKLIDKQAAIDALKEAFNPSITNFVKAKMAIDNLPSAQPEPIKINIEDFNKEDWERFRKEWRNTPITVLSAQPEIIRCKDCKYWVPGYITDNDDFILPKCGEWQQMVGHSSDDYCSLAERREVTT